jgi:hypothetical protein
LKGSKQGQPLLNLLPCRPLPDRARCAGDRLRKIAQFKFRSASNGFGALAAAFIEFAAVQRYWRDSRMAT